MRYEVCYIDDEILPYGDFPDTTKISLSDFQRFLAEEHEWQHQVKETIELNVHNAAKFRKIDFYGFTQPEFFITYKSNTGINPDTIILDWDFGVSKAEEYIQDIIDRTTVKNLFILSGNAPINEIRGELDKYKKMYTAINFDVFEKSTYTEEDVKTQEEIVAVYNQEFFKLADNVEIYGRNWTFHPSSIVPNREDIWMLESILGTEFFLNEFGKHDYVINHGTIESVVDASTIRFYTSRDGKRLYTLPGMAYAKYFGDYEDWEELKPIAAIKYYDLFVLEQAVEKCYANISTQ